MYLHALNQCKLLCFFLHNYSTNMGCSTFCTCRSATEGAGGEPARIWKGELITNVQLYHTSVYTMPPLRHEIGPFTGSCCQHIHSKHLNNALCTCNMPVLCMSHSLTMVHFLSPLLIVMHTFHLMQWHNNDLFFCCVTELAQVCLVSGW